MLCLIKKKIQQIKFPKRTMRWANTETANTVAGTRSQVSQCLFSSKDTAPHQNTFLFASLIQHN